MLARRRVHGRRRTAAAASARVGVAAIAVGLLIVARGRHSRRRPAPTSCSTGAIYTARVLLRLDDPEPPALHRAARGSAPPMLERERDEEAKRAVADERLRIAQELHDVVAHSMGVIAVQAGVGAHVIDTDPGRGQEVARGDRARRAARRSPRSAACSACCATTSAAAYQPAPGLADLDRLVADLDARRPRRSTLAIDGHAPTSCRPASTSPRTASCRRRSRTC